MSTIAVKLGVAVSDIKRGRQKIVKLASECRDLSSPKKCCIERTPMMALRSFEM